jgi:rhodanese-related sulfurtransferase
MAQLIGKVRARVSDVKMITAYTLDVLMKNHDKDRIVVNDTTRSTLYVKKGALGVIDARTYEEFSRGHISGAYIMPPDTSDERLRKFLQMAAHQGHRVFVTYCNSSHTRSTSLAKRIEKETVMDPIHLGELDVYVLDGALKNWVKTNPLVDINLKTGEFR